VGDGFVPRVSRGRTPAPASTLIAVAVEYSYRRRGIGTELVRRVLAGLAGFYSIDVVCDPELRPFYERFGTWPLHTMALRRR
jgi:predicted N-acetyltransferase YhbS